jgi:hypothetical protein
MPSRSQLTFVSNFLTRSHRKLGPMVKNSRSAVLGLTGIRSIGSITVGRTDSEIEVPMLVKNVLNSSAIQ